MNKKIIIIIAAVIAAAVMVFLVSNVFMSKDEKTDDTSSIVEFEQSLSEIAAEDTESADSTDKYSSPAESSSKTNAENGEGNTSKKAQTTENADPNGLTTEQAAEILTDFYGTTYRVNAAEYDNGYQSFNITDKKGNAYATVKVELASGKATETIIQTNEVNEYNLLV